MAMTAWSAKVFSSSICLSVNGRTSARADDDRRRWARRRGAAARRGCCGSRRPRESPAPRTRDPPARRGRGRSAASRIARPSHGVSAGPHREARWSGLDALGRARCACATSWSSVAVDAEMTPRVGARTGASAFSAMVSKTGWTSVGEPRDDPQDLAGRRLLLQGLGEIAVARLELRNRRTFSMAMTAWSANVFSRSICLSVNGRTSVRADHDRADGLPSRSIGTASIVRSLRRQRVSHAVLGIGQHVGNVTTASSRIARPTRRSRLGASGYGAPHGVDRLGRDAVRWRRAWSSSPSNGRRRRIGARTAARRSRRWCRAPAGGRSASRR